MVCASFLLLFCTASSHTCSLSFDWFSLVRAVVVVVLYCACFLLIASCCFGSAPSPAANGFDGSTVYGESTLRCRASLDEWLPDANTNVIPTDLPSPRCKDVASVYGDATLRPARVDMMWLKVDDSTEADDGLGIRLIGDSKDKASRTTNLPAARCADVRTVFGEVRVERDGSISPSVSVRVLLGCAFAVGDTSLRVRFMSDPSNSRRCDLARRSIASWR